MADKISFGDLLNATIKVSNNSDTKRKFDIAASVTIKDKTVTDIRSGQVFDKGADIQRAYFSSTANKILDIGFYDTKTTDIETQTAILVAVNAFIADTVASVSEITSESVLV